MSTPSFPASGPADPDRDPAEFPLNRHARRALAKRSRAGSAPDGDRPGLQFGRRAFLQALAAGGALAAAHPVTAAAAERRGSPGPGAGLRLAPPSFTEISSQLAFGPPTDVSAGWDGTLWAVDATGAPQLYDPMTDTWAPQDSGVDAVAAFGVPGVIYHFRSDSYVKVTGGTNEVQGPPAKIADTWPNLPQSFTQSVQGAANVNGDLYLFSGGLYVVAQQSGPAPVPGKLTDLVGWPQTPVWKGGVIDAASSDASGQSSTVQLYRDDQVLSVDMAKRQVNGPPIPLSSVQPWQGHVPASWVAGGIDAGYYYTSGSTTSTALYRGVATIFFHSTDQGTAVPQYLPTVFHGWPTWNPVLTEAPGGRAGALSAAAADGTVLAHDGTGWAALPEQPDGGPVVSVSAGRDGVVYAATTAAVHRLDGSVWTGGIAPGGQVAQVAVGDAGLVWARDASNTVYRVNGADSSATPATLLGAASHIAANADGTVWRCNEDPNTYRFISEGTLAPQQIPLGQGGAAVRKVASTGFGNSFCLTSPSAAGAADGSGSQLFAYQSDYQFKTAQSYNAVGFGTIAEGAGMVFLYLDESKAGQTASAVVGLDMHTGDQLFAWAPPPSDQGAILTNPVFDPINQLLYVGTSGGALYALDILAQDDNLQLVWSYFVPGKARIDAAPALVGSNLCFGDSNGVLYMINTGRAAAAAPAPPKPVWTHAGPAGAVATQVATPLIQNGEANFVTWTTDNTASPTVLVLTTLSLADGTVLAPAFNYRYLAGGAADFVPAPPVPGTLFALDKGKSVLTPAIFLNVYDSVVGIIGRTAAYPGLLIYYTLERGSHFTSGMAFDQGSRVLWVGDNRGRLFGLSQTAADQPLAPVANTPIQPLPDNEILTTPVVYTDTTGATSVLFGTVGDASTELWIFDPAEPNGDANPASVQTGQTRVSQLSASVANGVVYAAGATYWQESQDDARAAGQVFSIYIDRAVQALRDFIVESQLMQDFDEPASDGAPPPTFARYQTHLTVVDELKAPRPYEPVKVWADQATTVSINGAAPVTIGPDDDEFAAAQAGADGVITLATGYLATDGSDETDVFAAPLRVWAGFMDPYERVAVFPDREFHARLAAAQAITDPASPNYDNPDVVNLQTAQDYSGATLFTSAQQSSGQPKAVASAIATMTAAVPISASGQAPAAAAPTGHKHHKHHKPPPLGSSPGKYLAYPGLPGGAFSPVNVAADRTAVIAAPVGLQYASNNSGTGAPAFAVLGHADATLAIDALDGKEFTQGGLLGAPHLGNIFSDLWNTLKKAAATITHVVVSIGKEIYAGIRFIINGVAWVFKHPLQFLDDVVAAVGAFFRELGTLIKNAVEAIGILFHFDEIIKTHNLLRTELLSRVNGDPNDTENYPGYANTITSHIKDVDNLFDQGAAGIKAQLDKLKPLVANGTVPPTLSTQKGVSSTPTTMFNVGPNDQSAPASSHSVACMWAAHKATQLKQGQVFYLPRSSGSAGATAPSGPTPLQQFFDGFLTSLGDNGSLHDTLQGVQSDVHDLFAAKSFTQAAEETLDVLIDVVELVVEGVLAITKALFDGLLKIIADFINFLFGDPKDLMTTPGLLTQPIQIPILSALYKDAFKTDLTFLDLAMLVSAIPVTIVYRVLSGHYPSQDWSTTPAGLLQGVDRTAIRNAFGILGCLGGIYSTLVGAIGDGLTALEVTAEDKPDTFRVDASVYEAYNTASAIGCCFVQACAEPHTGIETPQAEDWAFWVAGWVAIASAIIAQLVEKYSKDQQADSLWIASSLIGSVVAIFSIVAAIYNFGQITNPGPTDIDKELFGANVAGNFPTVLNPAIYFPYAGLIVPPLDVLCGLGSAAVQLIATIQTWKDPLS